MVDTLPDLIRTLRSRGSLTQEAFAREIGVSFATVNRWENGKITPDRVALSDIRNYAARLGSDAVDLLADIDRQITLASESPRRRGKKRGAKNETLPSPSTE